MDSQIAGHDIPSLLFAPVKHLFFGKFPAYWLYLLCAVLLAVVFIAWQLHRKQQLSWHGLIEKCFPGKILLHPSATLDYRFFYVDSILYYALTAPFLIALMEMVRTGTLGLITGAGFQGVFSNPGLPVVMGLTVLSAILYDFCFYLTHYLGHRIPLWWELHKVHHSAEVLTPITAYRAHPLDTLLSTAVGTVCLGVIGGLFDGLYGIHVPTLALFGTNLLRSLFYASVYNLRHSHIWMDFGPLWSKIFISPAQHQIHHSMDVQHLDKNFGEILAVWDWLFGTLYLPRPQEEGTLDYGITPEENKNYKTLWQLYTRPISQMFLPKTESSSSGTSVRA